MSGYRAAVTGPAPDGGGHSGAGSTRCWRWPTASSRWRRSERSARAARRSVVRPDDDDRLRVPVRFDQPDDELVRSDHAARKFSNLGHWGPLLLVDSLGPAGAHYTCRATSHVTLSGLARERQAGPRPADWRSGRQYRLVVIWSHGGARPSTDSLLARETAGGRYWI
jgi:hypothetical protein